MFSISDQRFDALSLRVSATFKNSHFCHDGKAEILSSLSQHLKLAVHGYLVGFICGAANAAIYKRYRLDMEHNNWWECFVYTPEGEFHDMMWALDSDHLFEGVEVVLSAMDSVMKDITENKERIEYGKDSAFYC